MSSITTPSTPHNNRIAYLIVLAGLGVALHIWKLPPALPDLRLQLGLSLVESGFLLSIVQIGGMSLGLIVGLLAQKIGLRRCIVFGLTLTALSSAGGALAASKVPLMLFRGLEGVGFLMVVMPGPALVRQLVDPARLSSMLGIWGCYIPLASIAALLGGSWMLSVSSWQVLWWVLTAITLLLAALVLRYVPVDGRAAAKAATTTNGAARPKSKGLAPAAGQPAAKKYSVWALVKMTLSAEGVWLAAAIFGLYAGQWIAVIGFLPTIYMLGGIAGTTAGVMTAIVAGANAIGTFAAGAFLHRGVRPRTLIFVGFIVMIVTAFTAFALDLPVSGRFFAVLMFSTFGGLIPTTLFVVIMQLAPVPQAVPASLGWMQQISALGQFLGPPLIAWVVTMADGWQATWMATGACAILGMALAYRMTGKYRL